jgi:LacI family transcriptional regulator
MALAPHGRKPTIYDIAKRCGVSGATVSRALSNSGYPVKPSVRAAIEAAATELGYTPNAVGRMLRRRESMDIGVVLPNLSNPYFTSVLLGLETEAHRLGFNVLLSSSFRDPDTEMRALRMLATKQVAGAIVSLTRPDAAMLREMQAGGVGFVTFDQKVEGLLCSRVEFDFEAAGRLAVDHLVAQGHTDIVFVSSPIDRPSRVDLRAGFLEGLARHGISVGGHRCLVGGHESEGTEGYEVENGRQLAAMLAERTPVPTAVFAANDITAFGVIQTLTARGIRVPEDVSVLGFDDLPFSAWVTPALSTIAHPAFETGAMAMRLLAESLKDRERISVERFAPRLVLRASVCRRGTEAPAAAVTPVMPGATPASNSSPRRTGP